MEFLYFLEGLRNPLCDTLFSLITHLGEETVFIVIGIDCFRSKRRKQSLLMWVPGRGLCPHPPETEFLDFQLGVLVSNA